MITTILNSKVLAAAIIFSPIIILAIKVRPADVVQAFDKLTSLYTEKLLLNNWQLSNRHNTFQYKNGIP